MVVRESFSEEVTPELSLGDTEGFTRQRGRKRHQVKCVQRHQSRRAVVVLLGHGVGVCVCVCVCLHTHGHAMRKQKGRAQQEMNCLGWIRKGALYVMLRSLEFIPKPQGSIERGFKQGSAVIRFAC